MEVTSSSSAVRTSTAHFGSGFANIRTSVLEMAAAKLGMSVDALRAELEAGKPLAHIAAVAGMAQEPVDDQRGEHVDVHL
jgi:hypothetical protein